MNIIKTISKVVDLMSSLFDDYDDCDEENVNAFEQKESIYSQSIHRTQENIQKICEVTIKGTLQNNGPLIVNKTYLTERVIEQKFM